MQVPSERAVADRVAGTCSVVVADDDASVRQAIAELLTDEDGIDVVGLAADGARAVDQCLRLRPDVLVVDVNMPAGGGEYATTRLSTLLPDLAIIAISAHSDRATRRRMAAAGARAFVAKGALDELVPLVLGRQVP